MVYAGNRKYQDSMQFDERRSGADAVYTPDASNHDPTNANATPNNGSVFLGIGSWSCQDWLTWLDALIAAFGSDAANKIWSTNWNNIPFEKATYMCQYDQTWLDELKKRGQNFNQDVTAKVYTGTGNIIKSTVGAVEGVGSAAQSTAKTLKILVPVVLVLAVIGIGWYAYKNYIK